MNSYQLVVIGGGPAGLAAAMEAWNNGIRSILLLERDLELGGILNQCIHPGFGLQIFKEELTGPEYAQRFIDQVRNTGIEVRLDTMVVRWETDSMNKIIYTMNQKLGWQKIRTNAVILSMGCRERTRGALSIPGDRPAGIFTAGTAQRFLNREGFMVGKKIVILGSGDIGLIMARRLTLEGAKVLCVVELMPWSNGLTRNIVQCLNDYEIPLYLSHTVVNVQGRERLEKLVIAEVDDKLNPISGTEKELECDTLLLSVGLIPENELSNQAGVILDSNTSGPEVDQNHETSIPGVFACGNVLHVHDLVDFVTQEAQNAGKNAAEYLNRLDDNDRKSKKRCIISPGKGIRYTVPQKLELPIVDKKITMMMRVAKPTKNTAIIVYDGDRVIWRFPKSRVVPSEMEKIDLPADDFNMLTHDSITVSLE